ncbi:MAG: divalent metal cation transporter, partial [Candidatus Eremiobacteraeota bacterium]|nr:divalent metal cation transporter [Candidatus Eremiobacteraeota bacterium]
SCVVGLAVNAFHVSPFKLLYYAGVLNGVISPPLLFIVTQISSNPKIMGPYTNSVAMKIAGWGLCAFMTIALIAFFL